jgi:signal transduction histidine kinase/CheY-like chemotaxis protein
MENKREKKERIWNIVIIVTNVAMIGGVIASFLFFRDQYSKKLNAENLANITNINQSSAEIASAYFVNRQQKLNDLGKYAASANLNHDDFLSFIYNSNSDADNSFELIGTDNKGFLAAKDTGGNFIALDYTSADYDKLQAIFSASGSGTGSASYVCTPEFTDPYTISRSSALYAYMSLDDGTGTKKSYTLMSVNKSASVSQMIGVTGGYAKLATTLMNSNGDYIIGNVSFKSSNLFTYFYKYNKVTYDEISQVRKDFQTQGSAVFYYLDSHGDESVFVCAPISGTEWYVVTTVPLSEYRTSSLDLEYTILVASILVLLMFLDLWYLANLNRRLKVSIAKEKEASEAKTEFLSRMSHDIRTPLNVIIGTTYLAKGQDNPPETVKYLSYVDQSSKFLLSLVNDILDLNKVESGKMELHLSPYPFAEFKETITSIIGPLCEEKGLEFKVEAGDSQPVLMLDKIRINQIFFNILSNSVKFTPRGGHLSLSFHVTDLGNGKAHLEAVETDDGIGMSKEFQGRMFEAFSQENRADRPQVQGTGLGLAIVKNLVSLMHGQIKVESEVGQGTKFFLSWDTEITDVPAEDLQKGSFANLAFLKGKKILLVEDNPLNAEIAQKILEKGGLQIDKAVNGLEGLDKFNASPLFAYDAILMDMRMPVMDGLTATEKIRSLSRADSKLVPIIAMTANAYDEDVDNCLKAGMNEHLSKPIDSEILFQTLAKEIIRAESEKMKR